MNADPYAGFKGYLASVQVRRAKLRCGTVFVNIDLPAHDNWQSEMLIALVARVHYMYDAVLSKFYPTVIHAKPKGLPSPWRLIGKANWNSQLNTFAIITEGQQSRTVWHNAVLASSHVVKNLPRTITVEEMSDRLALMPRNAFEPESWWSRGT